MEGYAVALCAEDHYAQAAQRRAAAVTLREQIQTLLPSVEREAFEQTIAITKAGLDEQAFARKWPVEAALLQYEAIDDALSDVCA